MVALDGAVDEALRGVLDPHFNVSLHEMGMVRRVEIANDGAVEVGIVYPCIGCPAWSLLQNEIKDRVGDVDGVSGVRGKVDWESDWDRSDMSPAAREYARQHGYRI